MNPVRFSSLLYGAVLLATSTAPMHGQQRDYLASEFRPPVALLAPALSLPGKDSPTSAPLSALDEAATSFGSDIAVFSVSEIRRSRAGTYSIVGAVLGAAIGTVALFTREGCRTPESMCGLGLPLYAGGGAIAGGAVGYFIARARQ